MTHHFYSFLDLLSNVKKQKTSHPVSGIKRTVDTLEEASAAANNSPVSDLKSCLKKVPFKDKESLGNLEEKEELISDYREKTKFTPFLAQFGIPLYKDIIGVCLQEIVKLSRRFPKEKIFQYRNWNGILCNVVSVPVCSNEKSFSAMNRYTKFIDDLPSHVRGHNNQIKNEDTAEWIINALGQKYEDRFILVAVKLGYPIYSKKMDKDTAHAMWEEANVNLKSQRVILMYM